MLSHNLLRFLDSIRTFLPRMTVQIQNVFGAAHHTEGSLQEALRNAKGPCSKIGEGEEKRYDDGASRETSGLLHISPLPPDMLRSIRAKSPKRHIPALQAFRNHHQKLGPAEENNLLQAAHNAYTHPQSTTVLSDFQMVLESVHAHYRKIGGMAMGTFEYEMGLVEKQVRAMRSVAALYDALSSSKEKSVSDINALASRVEETVGKLPDAPQGELYLSVRNLRTALMQVTKAALLPSEHISRFLWDAQTFFLQTREEVESGISHIAALVRHSDAPEQQILELLKK